MLLLLDTADVRAIARAIDLFPIAGVTTNPTLIARERRPLGPLLDEIRAILGAGAMLHAQVVAPDAETMVTEAERLRDRLGAGFHPKVPVTAQGLKAIRRLADAGFAPTATAVVTPLQALIAARAGAAFVAPYVNRVDAIGGDGVRVVADIVRLFDTHHLPTRLLTASFKSAQQVLGVALAGAHTATLAPDLLDTLLAHPLTDAGVEGFLADWAGAYGPATTVLDLLPGD
ncbi:transaldolase [Siculibacillus lacustris]|uniref:Transaldolase n=1 Tax=Siculibacillus lacustris TaxID=1549641 RepID=A0A4V2KSL9_9HYPH|nr:transaldolase family protein [Siculibacillus lacustris]TBW33438.1 transaldolase [Siculibacillus lacustris]